MINTIISILQGLFLIGISPLFIGIINKLKSNFQSRKGPSIMQPYYDLGKLFRKDSVVSKTTSWIFKLTPYVCLISVILTSFLVPVFFAASMNIMGGFLIAIYILAAGRLFMILSGLDAGTAFGGMGSSREAMISALVEPIVMLVLFSVALITKTFYMGESSRILAESGFRLFHPSLFLSFIAMYIITLAENARIPFDNPTTHLELTMVHEAMILEFSGKSMGMMELSSWTKHIIFFTILANLFFPWGIATEFNFIAIIIGLLIWFSKVLLIAISIALVESAIAKFRLFQVPNLLGLAFVFALTAILLYLTF